MFSSLTVLALYTYNIMYTILHARFLQTSINGEDFIPLACKLLIDIIRETGRTRPTGLVGVIRDVLRFQKVLNLYNIKRVS